MKGVSESRKVADEIIPGVTVKGAGTATCISSKGIRSPLLVLLLLMPLPVVQLDRSLDRLLQMQSAFGCEGQGGEDMFAEILLNVTISYALRRSL